MNFDIKSDEIADTMCDYFVTGKVEAKMKNLISLFTWDKKNKEFISQMMKDRMDIEWLEQEKEQLMAQLIGYEAA